MKQLEKINWKELFSRLPLPMLALAASWGVYEFSRLYVPEWVAVVQAGAFELTYISISIQRDLSQELRKRANWIAWGAVACSVLYNSISGYMHRNEVLFTGEARAAFEIGLAILHGLPLAGLAYLVANLLLHSEKQPEPAPAQPIDGIVMTDADIARLKQETAQTVEAHYRQYIQERDKALNEARSELERLRHQLTAPASAQQPQSVKEEPTRAAQIRQMRDSGAKWEEIAAHFGKGVRTVQQWAKEG